MIKILDRDAVLSDCGTYRYLLRRVWDYGKPRALVIMLNPSVADAKTDDATIRSLYRLLDALSFGSYEVVNLFAFRATDPSKMAEAADPIGPLNAETVKAAINRCDVVICAWGAHPMAAKRKPFFYRPFGVPFYCFGLTKSGAPRHPLYIKSGARLEVFT